MNTITIVPRLYKKQDLDRYACSGLKYVIDTLDAQESKIEGIIKSHGFTVMTAVNPQNQVPMSKDISQEMYSNPQEPIDSAKRSVLKTKYIHTHKKGNQECILWTKMTIDVNLSEYRYHLLLDDIQSIDKSEEFRLFKID